MEKKNTGLIVLVIVLFVAVLGLGGFIVYDKVLNTKDNASVGSNEESKVENVKLNSLIKLENFNVTCHQEECVFFENDELKLSAKGKLNNNFYLEIDSFYINGNVIKEDENYNFPTVPDSIYITYDNYIIVNMDLTGESRHYVIYDKNGKNIGNLHDILSGNLTYNIDFKDNTLVVENGNYMPDYYWALCRDFKPTDYISFEDTFNYLGNGKFGNKKTKNIATVEQLIQQRYKMTCDELKKAEPEKFQNQ